MTTKEENRVRRCSKCKKVQPIENYRFLSTGLRAKHCNSCRNRYLKEKADKKFQEALADGSIDNKKINTKIRPAHDPKEDLPQYPPKDASKRQLKGAVNFYKSCFVNAYENLAALGINQGVIQKIFGQKPTSFMNHTNQELDGDRAYQDAMEALQNQLAQWALVKGLGYNYEEEKTTYVYDREKKRWYEQKKEVYKKHNSGSPELLIFYLTNRFPNKWKVSKELVRAKAPSYDDNPASRNRRKIESLAVDVLTEDTNEAEG